MPLRAILVLVLILPVLAGCNPASLSPEVVTPTATSSPTPPAPTTTSTPRPTRTPTPTSTDTPTSTPTATPTALLLVLADTPLPQALDPLNPDNAPSASGLASWRAPALTDLAWTPDGRSLAVAGADRVTFYDPNTRAINASLDAGEGLSALAFSPDGSWLTTAHRLYSELWGSEYGTIELWRGPAWTSLGPLYIDSRGVSQVAFTPDSRHFAAAFSSLEIEQDSLVEIWNTTTWEITRTLQLGTALNIEFSPDGALLASVPDRYATKLWQMEGGRLAYNLRTAFTDAVNSLAFSSDGSLLATGHYDGSLRLWNAQTGELVLTMQSEGVIESLAFSPLNNLLASGSSFDDTRVRLWSVETGQLLRELEGHTHAVEQLAFSPDGRLLASASYDGNVRLWGLRPGSVIATPVDALPTLTTPSPPTISPFATAPVGVIPTPPTSTPVLTATIELTPATPGDTSVATETATATQPYPTP